MKHLVVATLISISTVLLLLGGCNLSGGGVSADDDEGGLIEPGDDGTITQRIGEGITATIETPVAIELSVRSDVSSYPGDAKTPLLQIFADLAEDETAVVSFTVESGLTARDEVVRAGDPGKWEELGTTRLSEDRRTVSIEEVDDLNGVWAVVAAPPTPQLTSNDTDGGKLRPTWKWTFSGTPGAVRYRLDGSGGEWTAESDTSVTSYTPPEALSLGEHTLAVQAGTTSGVWSKAAQLTIDVGYLQVRDLGFGVKYKFTDDYVHAGGKPNGGAPFSVWIVNQTEIQTGAEAPWGIQTVTATEDFDYAPHSALAFSTNLGADTTEIWGYVAGIPGTTQAQLFRRLLVLPRHVTDGQEESDPDGVLYRYEVLDPATIGGESRERLRIDTIIDGDAADALSNNIPAKYYEGSGFVVLAEGIGAVQGRFDRADGSTFSFDYAGEHGIQAKHTLTGTVEDTDGPVSGRYVTLDGVVGQFTAGETAYEDPLPGARTGANGGFELAVYGPVARLFIGRDSNDDGRLDLDTAHEKLIPDTENVDRGTITVP